jgi:hypothetical protein
MQGWAAAKVTGAASVGSPPALGLTGGVAGHLPRDEEGPTALNLT